MDQPDWRIYEGAIKTIYGPGHPLQFNSGGTPDALRDLTPAHIRSFHAAHYFLANMGAIVSVPADVTLTAALQHVDALLTRVERQRPERAIETEDTLPTPKPTPAGEIRFVEYPHRNDQQPGAVYLAWPANREIDVAERTLLELFLSAFAGDPATNLYKRLIDSKTREIPLGAQSVSGSTITDQGIPVIVEFGDVPVAKMNVQELGDLRARVMEELARVAALPAGSGELKDFNDRVRSRIIEKRRSLAKFVNSPPGFGLRSTGDGWIAQLHDLNKQGGFKRSLTMKPILASIEQAIAQPGNIWTAKLASWKLTSEQPWVLAAKPDTALAIRQQQERAARGAAEIARLKTQYGAPSDQTALERYRADYDAGTKVIDEASARVTPPRFVDKPPLTLDDQLQFKSSQLTGGIPLVSSTFTSMAGATTGIALRLDGVPADKLLYLAALPALLTRVGVIDNGRPVSFEDMSERLRLEILRLSADFTTNAKNERVELTVRGSGNDVTESRRAVEWMRLALFHPDWRPENLPRIRDLLDQMVNSLRRTPQTSEENWVRPVATAYWRQHNPLFLTATSFMTQTHQIHRLRWMLKAATAEQRAATMTELNELAGFKGTRAELKAVLAPLAAGQNAVLADAAKDLDATLAEVPDSSLGMDWVRLCREMADDLAVGPEATLATLDTLRKDILKTANARLFIVGSTAAQQTLATSVTALVGELGRAPVTRVKYGADKLVDMHLRERDNTVTAPRYVGLLNPNSQSGVFLNSAPGATMEDTDRDKVLDYLAAIVYAGGGSHSVFTKTIGAGLAYSNGLGASPVTGRIQYYAERTPDLPQTLQFVVEYLKAARPDPTLVEYAIAQSFTGTRAANSYESRGEAMSQNLADGLTPAIVSRFHKQILELRTLGPALVEELTKRKNTLPARVLPGLSAGTATTAGTVLFVIGPEKQFASWEQYLASVEGQTTTVARLYPRDFWLPAAWR